VLQQFDRFVDPLFDTSSMESAKSGGIRRFLIYALGVLSGLLLLYALSIGPVCYYQAYAAMKPYRGAAIINVRTSMAPPDIYTPLFQATGSTVFSGPFNSYCEWWFSLGMKQVGTAFFHQRHRDLASEDYFDDDSGFGSSSGVRVQTIFVCG
jgi:hypothetical protein